MEPPAPQQRAPQPQPVTVAVQVIPKHATLSVNGGPRRPGPLRLTALPGEESRLVQVRADGYKTQQFLVSFDRSRTERVKLVPARTRRMAPRFQRTAIGKPAAQSTQPDTTRETEDDPFSVRLTRPPRKAIDVTDPFQD
jgi:hypothetical protein